MGARSCLYSSIPHVKSKQGQQLAGDKGGRLTASSLFPEGTGAGGSQAGKFRSFASGLLMLLWKVSGDFSAQNTSLQ